MIALVFENLKLVMLFLLIGTIIGLSHIRDEAPTRMKNKNQVKHWRAIVPRLR
jgi:hypothetical protein